MWSGIGDTKGFRLLRRPPAVGAGDAAEHALTEGWKKNKLQGHRLVDEHNGDAVADEVGAFPVLTNQQSLKIGSYFSALEI